MEIVKFENIEEGSLFKLKDSVMPNRIYKKECKEYATSTDKPLRTYFIEKDRVVQGIEKIV